MPRLEELAQPARQRLVNFPCFDHDDAPATALRRPLPEAKLALVTTAGLHLRGDDPFAVGEQTYRVIPADTPARDILQSQTSSGFDRTAFMQDVNISFPIDRLRELADRGAVGSTPT